MEGFLYLTGIAVLMAASESWLISGLRCYECGGTSGRECSKDKEAGDIVKTETIVSCNSTAHSCMFADRDDVIEQRTCWSAEVKGCTNYIPGQSRVCACLSELCNCQGEGGPAQMDIECPTFKEMPSNASDYRHRFLIMVIALLCAFMLPNYRVVP